MDAIRAIPAVRAALAVSNREMFSRMARAVTLHVSERGSAAVAREVERVIPERSISLVELSLWTYRAQIRGATHEERARLLNHLGIRLRALGKREKALESTLRDRLQRLKTLERPVADDPVVCKALAAFERFSGAG